MKSNNYFEIRGRKIGCGHPTYIIAEAGVNHNGDAILAKKLIDAAKKAKADCVKFQTFKADRIVTRNAPKANYQLLTTDPAESQLEMLQKLELNFESYKELIQHCQDMDIEFMSTPYSLEDIQFLEKLGVNSYKIASGQIVEPDFLCAVAKTGKPFFLSTGMATLAEVDEALRIIRKTGNDKFVLLQCTTNYPSQPQDANLRAMSTMENTFDIPIGYSDHTQSNTACIVAIGLGACVIEKHLTLDKNMKGPDHSTSINPKEFSLLVSTIREAESTLGSSLKEPAEKELENITGMRRSITAARKISKGEILKKEMFVFKRPGTGIKPTFLSEIIGCVATSDIKPDEMISWQMCGK